MDTAKVQRSFLLKSYNTELGVLSQRTMTGTNYIAYVNSLRDMNGLIHSLKDALADNAVIEELWLRRREEKVSDNTKVGSLDAYNKKPNIAKSCTHVILVMSEDERILEYSKFLVNRYMNMYTSVVPTKELPKKVRCEREKKRGGHIPQKVHKKSEPTVEKVEAPTSFMQKVTEKVVEKLMNWLK